MGGSISSGIAQLVLEDLEETVIPNLYIDFPFLYGYVDDCITDTPKDKINYILKSFNNYHPKLQFTLEMEQSNIIIFLDLTPHKKN